jgi:5-deoxy-glucuronate isomerase
MPEFFHSIPEGRGLKPLKNDACELLDFAKLDLLAGETHQSTVAEARELLLLVLSGTVRVEIGNGPVFDRIGSRPNVFAGKPHSVYIPRGSGYTITAHVDAQVALPSAPSKLDVEAYEIVPESVREGQWGTLNYTRYFREVLVQANGHPAASLIVGETITPSGHWSTYPPHKHEANEGAEAYHEEMYYFRLSDPAGFGLTRHYSPDRGYDNTYTVKDDSLLSIPHGYHTYVGAPGCQSYYLWFLAGDGRRQGVTLDPRVGWVQKTVGMF